MPFPEVHLAEKVEEATQCYHCGNDCQKGSPEKAGKHFCCNGCLAVYDLLEQKDLCEFYDFEAHPGKSAEQADFAFLDKPEIAQKLILFQNNTLCKSVFYIPSIHCSSCIWILENLRKFDAGIIESRTNFIKKQVTITFDSSETSLRNIANILAKIGYKPHFSLDSQIDTKPKEAADDRLLLQVGVAAFCFGNLMLTSLPEYLGYDSVSEGTLKNLFTIINLILGSLAFFYSGWRYVSSAVKGLKQRIFNIDFPLALGMVVLYGRSLYEIFTFTGAGYMDSVAGLICFLLAGRWFQEKTYNHLSFSRNYESFFPLSVILLKGKKEEFVLVENLKAGDRILVRNAEIIPADGIIIKGEGKIDYSFVSGEAEPVKVLPGNEVKAGGRQTAQSIEIELVTTPSKSYLTSLWNHDVFTKVNSPDYDFSQSLAVYFTPIVLLIALLTGIYWAVIESNIAVAVNAFTAVLVVACPCALVIAAPFALSNAMAILGKHKLWIKNTSVIEKLATIQVVVFDKTGTITSKNSQQVRLVGDFTESEIQLLKSAIQHSSHPLSVKILSSQIFNSTETLYCQYFKEFSGKGIEASIGNDFLRMGSAEFCNTNEIPQTNASMVYVAINGINKGYFVVNQSYRNGLGETIKSLQAKCKTYLLSGDNDSAKKDLTQIFGNADSLFFKQSTEDKLLFIKNLQKTNQKVAMLGDGLNDAGALRQSNVGIAVSENSAYFTPACEAILDAESFNKLPSIFEYSKNVLLAIKIGFSISLIYNCIALYFSMQGLLTPVIAAILMPTSSISLAIFSVSITNLLSKKIKMYNTL